MTRKKKDEDTASNTDAIGEGEKLPDFERLLGPRSLRRPQRDESDCLLRIHYSSLNVDIMQILELRSLPISANKDYAVVLGPFALSHVRNLLQSEQLKPGDQLIKGFDRWKPLRSIFPELSSRFESSEEGHTHTDTASASGASFEETQTESNSIHVSLPPSKHELGDPSQADVDPGLDPKPGAVLRDGDSLFKSQASSLLQEYDSIKLNNEQESLEIENLDLDQNSNIPSHLSNTSPPYKKEALRAQRTSKPLNQNSMPEPGQAVDSVRLNDGGRYFKIIIGALAFAGLGFFFLFQRPIQVSNPPHSPGSNDVPKEESASTRRSTLSESNPAWPVDLQPRSPDRIWVSDEDPIVRRVQKIVSGYQLTGAQVFKKDDELFLRSQVSEGSSSPRAQLLASNHLALHYLARKESVAARRVLLAAYDENPNDLATLINLGVTQFVLGEYGDAMAITDSAMRSRSNPSASWFASAIHGLSLAKNSSQPRKEDVDKDFKLVEQQNSNNPIFYGLWLRALQMLPTSSRPEVQKAIQADSQRHLQKALWSDPDKIIDSSFELTPLARAWFVKEAFEGLSKAAAAADTKISRAQQAFLDLLVARRSPGVALERIRSPEVQEQLNRERVDDPLSQLLFGFMLKEEGKINEAASVVTLLTKDPAKNTFLEESSYPLSFAGELAMVSGNFDDARLLFQQASERNRYDVNALFGFVLMAREQGAYTEARSKLDQVLAVDPSFYPALLRQGRFVSQRIMFDHE